MRRLLAALLLCAGLAACGSSSDSSGREAAATSFPALRGAPPELATLRRQAGDLLGGGDEAFKARLGRLRGHPVVVNKWASWCPPCRAEFPFFRSQAAKRGATVAFLGVDANDVADDARGFLREHPVPYPSFQDPDQKVAAVFNGTVAFPTTAYYDSKGRLAYVKQGGYATEEKLAEDIERYAR